MDWSSTHLSLLYKNTLQPAASCTIRTMLSHNRLTITWVRFGMLFYPGLGTSKSIRQREREQRPGLLLICDLVNWTSWSHKEEKAPLPFLVELENLLSSRLDGRKKNKTDSVQLLCTVLAGSCILNTFIPELKILAVLHLEYIKLNFSVLPSSSWDIKVLGWKHF